MPIRFITAHKLATRATLAAVLALPCAAFSQVQAVTNEPVNLMSGPGDDYPVVAGLAPNQPVEVMGCVSGYEWCDVVLDDLRGWVYGGALTYAYEGNYVPLISYGAVIGLPVVVFSFDSYWDNYYRGRPWYGDRDRWRHGGPSGYPGHPYQAPPQQSQPYRPPGQLYPNGGNAYAPPGQPVYRPNTGPVPHGGQPQPQGQPQQQFGGRPPAPVQPQPHPQAQQPQQQFGGRPPMQERAQPQQQPQSRGQQNEGHREPPQ
jgi:uncharacterized protein YraI